MARTAKVQTLINDTVGAVEWAVGWSLSLEWKEGPSGYQIDVKNTVGKSLSEFRAFPARLDAEGEEALVTEYVDDPINQSLIDRDAAEKPIGNNDASKLTPMVLEPIG